MHRYRYQHGDRPLEGYTIQRAAGRGGFGEVYYAVSDGGREVALKAVQNYEQIELRGISQCMNLKSPHLVTIFDVKHNDQGEPFVLMEYVSGPSLHDLLAESPNGIGTQKAAYFLREIAKGLSYLHDCGIVHRDLKPGNIFYEHGYVKIGDYGLTKAISASRHSGQTITVGTVHYMAPEIGAGKYNRSIDIYALGILLYEMLTGEVPFAGSSPGEILMKHMSVEPELHGIEEPFAGVIRKALAKDPTERYQTVQEMVEDLYGCDNIRNSVSQFSPEELSVVAAHAAAKANIGEQDGSAQAAQPTVAAGVHPAVSKAERLVQQADEFGQKVAGRVDAEASKLLGDRFRIPGVTDPVTRQQRRTLAFLTMVIVSVGAGILQARFAAEIIPTALAVFGMIGVSSQIMIACRRRWFANLEPESRWVGKLVTCCLAALGASVVATVVGGALMGGRLGQGGPLPSIVRLPFGGGSLWLALALPMLLVDWGRISSPRRAKRLSLGSAIWIALLGLISAGIFVSDSAVIVAAALAGTSLVIQAVSAFGSTVDEAEVARIRRQQQAARRASGAGSRRVPAGVRIGWLVLFFIALSVGLSLLIWSAMENMRDDEFAAVVAPGVDCLILAIFCLVGACRQKFNGWYRYIIKPGILLICVLSIVASSICMGVMNLRNEDFFISLLFILLPSIAFLIVTFLPASIFDVSAKDKQPAKPRPKPASPSEAIKLGVSPYKRMWALILASGGLFGFNGLHRFYVGKIGTGILWFLTGGLLGIGQLIDVILIIVGQFTDHEERPLVVWQDESEAAVSGVQPAVAPSPAAAPAVAATPAWSADGKEGAETPERAAEVAPAVERPVAPSSRRFYSSTMMFEGFHPFAFLLSGVGLLLAIMAILLGVAMALHLPHFVAAGWPERGLATDMERLFGFSEWPNLAMRLGIMISVVMMLLAAVCMIFGRRHLGARHLLRAVLGLAGFACAILWLADGVGWQFERDISAVLAPGEVGLAFDRLLAALSSEYGVGPALAFLVSVVILAWPPRRKQTTLTPPLVQGVAL